MKNYDSADHFFWSFQNLSQVPINESLIMYQPLLSITFSFFNSKTLGKSLSIPSLKNIMSVLLGLMADQKLSSGDDGQYTKVVNGICLKILDKTNFTNLNWYVFLCNKIHFE